MNKHSIHSSIFWRSFIYIYIDCVVKLIKGLKGLHQTIIGMRSNPIGKCGEGPKARTSSLQQDQMGASPWNQPEKLDSIHTNLRDATTSNNELVNANSTYNTKSRREVGTVGFDV